MTSLTIIFVEYRLLKLCMKFNDISITLSADIRHNLNRKWRKIEIFTVHTPYPYRTFKQYSNNAKCLGEKKRNSCFWNKMSHCIFHPLSPCGRHVDIRYVSNLPGQDSVTFSERKSVPFRNPLVTISITFR